MSRFFRSLASIFMPPFDGLAFVAILYIIWAHMIYPHNDIVRGNLPDPDDYMYLTQVLDWVTGQGWYDNIQHRLDPPAGVPIHFSRLAQLPMALGILIFKKLGLGWRGSALLVALIEPILLLACCFAVLRRLSAFVVPAHWAGASAYVLVFAIGLLFEFMPGHVDHHGLVILLICTSVGGLLFMFDHPDDVHALAKGGAFAGFILALALTIALECLPWVLLLSAILGLWAMTNGKKAALGSALYAGVFVVTSVIGLALTRPPSTFFEPDILTFSIVYIALALAVALPFTAVALTAFAVPAWRWTAGLTVALLCAEFFLRRFPELASGPYGAIDPQLVPILLNNVQEARPILDNPHGSAHMINLMSMGFLALPIAFFFTWHAQNAERWKWSLITAVFAAAFFMTIFYQYRFLGIEAAFAVIPLTAFLYRGWLWIAHTLSGRKKVLAELGLLIVVGPLPAVIFPALIDGRSFNVGMLLFPVDSGRSVCDMAHLEKTLRNPHGLGDKTRLIVSSMELGPEFLFRTRHHVLAAPFHMDVQGNVDAARFLSTSYPQEAENIARARGVDLVVVCRAVADIYIAPKDQPPSLVERLFTGKAPDWLERIPANDVDNFVIYGVKAPSTQSP
jgi:hypothetical protein